MTRMTFSALIVAVAVLGVSAQEPVLGSDTIGVAESTAEPAPVIVATAAPEEATAPASLSESGRKKGKSRLIGVGFGGGFYVPFNVSECNEFIDTVYENMKDAYESDGYLITSEKGAPAIFMGFHVGGHLSVRPLPWLSVDVHGRYVTAPKKLAISTSSTTLGAMADPDVEVSLTDGVFGTQIVGYLTPRKTVSLKAGFSLEWHWISFSAKQVNEVTLSGRDFGVSPMIGLAIAPGSGRVLIGLDLSLPIASTTFTKSEGQFVYGQDTYMTYYNVTLPTRVAMTGLEFRPSVTVCFP